MGLRTEKFLNEKDRDLGRVRRGGLMLGIGIRGRGIYRLFFIRKARVFLDLGGRSYILNNLVFRYFPVEYGGDS